MTLDTKALEAAAKAVDAGWDAPGPPFEQTEREYQQHCRDTARSAIEAYLSAASPPSILEDILGDADNPESLASALEIASIGGPYTDLQGQLYGNPRYSPDGFRDAEFRDYGLARAVRIICNHAAAIRSLKEKR